MKFSYKYYVLIFSAVWSKKKILIYANTYKLLRAAGDQNYNLIFYVPAVWLVEQHQNGGTRKIELFAIGDFGLSYDAQ